MEIRSSLAPTDSLLVGHLEIVPGPDGARPALSLICWCPACRRHHEYPWPGTPFRSDAVQRVAVPCRAGARLFGATVHIGLDPSRIALNRWTVRQFARLRDAWAASAPAAVEPATATPVPCEAG